MSRCRSVTPPTGPPSPPGFTTPAGPYRRHRLVLGLQPLRSARRRHPRTLSDIPVEVRTDNDRAAVTSDAGRPHLRDSHQRHSLVLGIQRTRASSATAPGTRVSVPSRSSPDKGPRREERGRADRSQARIPRVSRIQQGTALDFNESPSGHPANNRICRDPHGPADTAGRLSCWSRRRPATYAVCHRSHAVHDEERYDRDRKTTGSTPDQLVGTWYRAGTEPDPNHRIGRDPNHLMFHPQGRGALHPGADTTPSTRQAGHVDLGDDGAFRTLRNGQTLALRSPGPSPAEALTITTVKLAVRVSLDEDALLFTTPRARLAPSTNMRQPPSTGGHLDLFLSHASRDSLVQIPSRPPRQAPGNPASPLEHSPPHHVSH